MALDGCGQICKVLLFLVNLLFVLAGMGMLCGGLYLRFSAEGPLNLDLKTQHFVFAVSVLMAVGAAILIAAAIGDYASCSENKSALGVYCSILAFLATLTIICGVLSYLNIREFCNHVGEFYATVYAQYLIKKDGIRAIILRLFHNAFDCCGLGGTLQTIMQETDTCPQKYSLMGISFSTSTSCVTAILADLQASTVLGTFIGIAGLMILAVALASAVWHQSSRSVSSPPPYVLLTSSIPLSSPSSAPSTSVLLYSPPPVTDTAEVI
ncbi:CD9 antigen isoform X1 [Astyanax mexicanus]|uniref:CD9 antigen isoform X1 n=1 Tax=Astyanax mexicanus TaxID=7994 RepID=UPI0020CB61FF|nr:CD9 antigen isoform X1 [Astyanax mexicanus]